MKITAAVTRGKAHPFLIEEVDIEEPRADEVLVKIVATGICHTDLVVRDQWLPVPLPIVLGHEGAGIVERVGQGVKKVQPGDHVVLTYGRCGQCAHCLEGRPYYCLSAYKQSYGGGRADGSTALHQHGQALHSHFFAQSSFATYALANEGNVVKVRRDVPRVDVTSAVRALQRGLAAVDGTGRALFAGLSARPWPQSPVGQLWRACDLVREHRGDSHIAAYITAGLDPVEMNILTELYVGMPLGSYTTTRAWSEERIAASAARLQQKGLVADGALTPAGLRLRQGIEDQTDAMEQPLIEALGSDFETLVTHLNEWAELCIKAGAFPPNVQKRAAG